MRHVHGPGWVIACGVFASCAVSPDAPDSSATFSAELMVHASRARAGFVSYDAPYHRWSITLATIEGCGGDNVAELEINTLSSVTEIPLGPIPVRTAEATIVTLPSAYVRYLGAPVLSGTVTIDAGSTTSFVAGAWTAQVMLNGTPTDLSATFGAPVCPSS